MAAKKIKTKKPPLSALDKFIYTMLSLLLFCGVMIGWVLLWFVPDRIAFSDPHVIAYTGDTLVLCAMPMTLVITMIILLFSYGSSKKQPIFGNKKFKVIGFQPMMKVYPVFSKAFRDNLSNKAKKTLKVAFTAWSISFAAALLILLLGIYPRDVLDDQNNFSRYNSFNQVTVTEHAKEADSLIIKIRTRRHRSFRTYRYIELGFVFEDHTYRLTRGSFREEDWEAVLEYMLYLKSFFNTENYEVRNMDQFEKLLQEEKFNARETELVYELFDHTAE